MEVKAAPPIPLIRRFAGIALGVLGWVGFLALSYSPALAELFAGTGPIPELRRGLSLLSGIIAFSLAELFVAAVLVRQLVGGAKGLRRLLSGEIGFARSVGAGTLRLAQDAGIVLFLFYLLWGAQYARPGLEARLEIETAGEVSSAELHRLALRAVETSNLLYREIHGSEDAGEPTSAQPISSASRALDEAWARVQQEFRFHPLVAKDFGAPKAFLASRMVKPFGIAGMHFPFTGEALVLGDLPAVIQGIDLGHEMAHQRGFAREDEANVLGFLVARASDDPVARYGAYVFLQRQLLSALQSVSPSEARELARSRDPGVTRDLEDLRAYWEPTQGVARAAATRANDVMLRSHGIPEGVSSYQGSVWVLIALARARGEEVLFPPPPAPAVSQAPKI